jgi:pilus assembly protein CpaE
MATLKSSSSVLVIAADEREAARLRSRLEQAGIDCPARCAVGEAAAAGAIERSGAALEMVFVGCPQGDARDLELVSLVRARTRAQIVAVGGAAESRRVLQLIRAGANDYWHDADSLDGELDQIIARLRADRPLGEATMMAVVSASGGCGGSTVAVNLAAAVAARGARCCLVDLNMRGGDLAAMLDLKPAHTLVDLCEQQTQVDAEMLQQSLVQHSSGLRLLASAPPLEDRGPIRHEIIERALQLTRTAHAHVVVDLEDVFHREQLAAIRMSHRLLIVLRMEFPCLLRTRKIIEYLKAEDLPDDRLVLVANRVGRHRELPREQVVQALGKPIAHFLPEDYATVAVAGNVGNPVLLEAPSSLLACAFKEMAQALLPA